ncbi:hypothetical protein BH09ACT12_BH09ACT12_08890 [soil metagenome]
MADRRLGTALAALVVLVVPLGCAGGDLRSGADLAPAAASRTTAVGIEDSVTTWLDGTADIASLARLQGHVELTETTEELHIELRHARMVLIPEECETSTVTKTTSAIVGADLVCSVSTATRSMTFTAIAVGRRGDEVSGTVTARRGLEYRTSTIPTRRISGGPATITPDLRLVSSPDFLNGDVGDLSASPGFWNDTPPDERTSNSINPAYERALDSILDDWESLRPEGVLVAGDLVDGRWGYDDEDSGNFGPVGTLEERRLALQRAARTYYPQWKQRFVDHALAVYPAMGDHEYGDNPWPQDKRDLAADFKAEFAREFTTDAAGQPLFADHPDGPARLTAYAGRPSPDVQVVTLDVFDITPERARVRVDPQQLAWLRDVLRQARRDDVEWVIVQAHVPILTPVRARDSSQLHYPRGTDSRLWKVFERFGVDLYLAGEVHDTTTQEADGIVQITHGGIFQFSLTTALVLDVYGDQLYVTLRDYDMHHAEDPDGTRLWETRRGGMPSLITVAPQVATIGTATITGKGLSASSGILVPPGDAN